MSCPDRNETLTIFRAFVHGQRLITHAALDIARAALRNDRQFAQFERSMRGKEREVREYILANLQQLGLADKNVSGDDLRHMR